MKELQTTSFYSVMTADSYRTEKDVFQGTSKYVNLTIAS